MKTAQILVLGAGPAGAAVALGLKRMGYHVVVVSRERRVEAIEGVSARVLQALSATGLHRAAAAVVDQVPRQVRWNARTASMNTEMLVERPVFDRALRADLLEAGIEVVDANVCGIGSTADGHRVHLQDSAFSRVLQAGFLVEARGRQASGAAVRLAGPATLTLLMRWMGTPGAPASGIESMGEGWAWMARMANGSASWQLALHAADKRLPKKDSLLDFCLTTFDATWGQAFFGTDRPAEPRLYARTSGAVLCAQAAGENWLRVGDAAMAVDPLSGNGVFQSLSSALQAPAVVNTLIRKPERAMLACQFHQRRIEHLFYRFARIGREFYADERRWTEQAFWSARSAWPDALPLHETPDPSRIRVERGAVINGGFIEEAEVVVTPDQPMGMWHLDGIALAELMKSLQERPAREVLRSFDAPQRARLAQWLTAQGIAIA